MELDGALLGDAVSGGGGSGQGRIGTISGPLSGAAARKSNTDVLAGATVRARKASLVTTCSSGMRRYENSLISELSGGNVVQIIDIDFLEALSARPHVFGTSHFLDLKGVSEVYLPLSDEFRIAQ